MMIITPLIIILCTGIHITSVAAANPGMDIQPTVHPITREQVWQVQGFIVSRGVVYEKSSVYISSDPRANTTFGVDTDTPTYFVAPFAAYQSINNTGDIINVWDLAQPVITLCNFQKLFLTTPGIAGCTTSHARIDVDCLGSGCQVPILLNGKLYNTELSLQDVIHVLPHKYRGCISVVVVHNDHELGVISCEEAVFGENIIIALPLLKGTIELRQTGRKLIYYPPQPIYVVTEGIFVFILAIWSLSILMIIFRPHVAHTQSARKDSDMEHLQKVFVKFDFYSVTVFMTVLSFTIYMVFMTAYNKGDTLVHTDISEYVFQAVVWVHLGVHVVGTLYCITALMWMLYMNSSLELQDIIGYSYIANWLDRIYWTQTKLIERREALLQFLVVFRVLYEYIVITGLHFYLSPEFGELARHTISFTFGVVVMFVVGRDTYEVVAHWGIVGICFLASVFAHVNIFMIMPTLPSMLVFPEAVRVHVSITITSFIYILSLFVHK